MFDVKTSKYLFHYTWILCFVMITLICVGRGGGTAYKCTE